MGAEKSAVKGYEDGVEYGRKVSLRMSVGRGRENDAFVRDSEYVRRGSPTRAFWLGFRRAVRGAS